MARTESGRLVRTSGGEIEREPIARALDAHAESEPACHALVQQGGAKGASGDWAGWKLLLASVPHDQGERMHAEQE